LLNPYELTEVGYGYEFISDHHLTYYVYFTDVSATFGVVDCVFSFGFELKHVPPNTEPPHDHRVGDTIATIVESFFLQNENIIIYVPYDKDKKDKLRMRLFDFWFHRYRPWVTCPLHQERLTFRLTADNLLTVTAIYKIEQQALVQQILFHDLPKLIDEGKE